MRPRPAFWKGGHWMRPEGFPVWSEDAYRRSLRTRTVRVDPGGEGRSLVELEDTVLYPAGGGQPADRGWVGEAPVVDVRKEEGRIVHVVEGPVEPGPVEVRLDWERRYDHMQQHTAQHLLTALAGRHLGWKTTGFGIGRETSSLDVDIRKPEPGTLRELEERVAVAIREARPVRVRWTDRDGMERLEVRSRRLPAGFEGPIRLIEIEGIDRNTCGGTHVASTAEVEAVAIVGTEPMHGGTRLHWVAGRRVRSRMAAREALLAGLRGLTGAGDAELEATVALKLEQLREARAEAARLRERLGRMVAESLAVREGPVVTARLEDVEILTAVASALAGSAGRKAFLLVAPDGSLALALAAGAPGDALTLGRIAGTILEARGGGRDRLYRGRAQRLDRLEEAGAAVATAMAERASAEETGEP